jgi:integrase
MTPKDIVPRLSGSLAEPAAGALTPAQAARVKAYIAASHADRTKHAYSRAWAQFTSWCDVNGHVALPATPETIVAWIVDLADGGEGRRPLSRATINLYLSAVMQAHHNKGQAFDRKHPLIARTWRGISRTKARQAGPRKAEPLMGTELRELIDGLGSSAIDARDAALLALGWAAALRRSELIGLDWRALGAGSGFVELDGREIVVTLPTSKGSQEDATKIVVPRSDMPTASKALRRWAAIAKLRPGEPVYRSINKGGDIASERLTDRSVSRIVKARLRHHAMARGKSEADVEKLVAASSSHSLRAGFATTAAEHDQPGYRIQSHMRHRSMDTTGGYIRAGEQRTKSGLKGVGF